MGKKEPSKGREWEKGRRNVLNQKFLELYEALPSYVAGQTISKKTILTQALSYIHQFKQGKEIQQKQGADKSNAEVLHKWVSHILDKFLQLVSLLNSLNVKVPKDFTSLEAPPLCISPEISVLLKNIEVYSAKEDFGSQIRRMKQRKKASGKKKANMSGDAVSSLSNINPKNEVFLRGGKVTDFQSSECGNNASLNSNSPRVPNNPLVVQPSPLQMASQLVFASNSASTPLSAPLPLLVSVTGVKTVNPFIVVQSNVMAPNSLSNEKVVSNRSGTRPIQPGPPNKATRKLKKVPIPSLKNKNIILSNLLPQSNPRKLFKRNTSSTTTKPSVSIKSDEKVSVKNPVKQNDSLNTIPVKVNKTPCEGSKKAQLESSEKKTKIDTILIETQSASASLNNESLGDTVPDGDKENVAKGSLRSRRDCDGNKVNHFSSVPSGPKEVSVEGNLIIMDHIKESDLVSVSEKSLPLSELNNDDELASKKDERNITASDAPNKAVKKRLCDEQLNCDGAKRSKCLSKENSLNGTKLCMESVNNLFTNGEGSSPVKMSKSSYTISALCAQQQQLLQNRNISPEDVSTLSAMPHEKTVMPEATKQTSVENKIKEIAVQEVSPEKTDRNSFSSGKSREVVSSSADLYSEWLDKSKSKSDRICNTYNLFSSLPLHNNKNTFIPISEIDSFKTVPESFDASDTSFGLPLHSSDISSDLFASLQVPAGGSHSESISPTAAFLLAFPLVSTSKATELLSDENVCENSDSQPGMKTILQIGNLDCDTPVTKCVSEFSNMESNVVYSTSNVFNQDSLSGALTKNKNGDSTADVANFIPKSNEENTSHKSSSQEHASHLRDGVNQGVKVLESSALPKDVHGFPPKLDFQTPCSNRNKGNCTTRHNSSTINSNQPLSQLDMSKLQSKQHDVQPASQLNLSKLQSKQQEAPLSSSENIFNKTSLKVNSSQDSNSFLACEKQNDWIEVPHSSNGTFSDFPREFPTSSSSQSDCAVNYVAPPVFSTSASGEEPASTVRSQTSSASILSWSTLSQSDNSQSLKHIEKSIHYQDPFPSSKSSTKLIEIHQLSTNPVMTTSVSHHSQLAPVSNVGVSDRLNSFVPAYNQNHHIDNSIKTVNPSNYDHGIMLSQKQMPVTTQHPPSISFISSGRNSEVKKSFSSSAERKRMECISSVVPPNSGENVNFTCQPINLPTGAPQPSSTLVYSAPEGKHVKASNVYYDERLSLQNNKMGMIVMGEASNPKQSVDILPYSQNSAVPELKQTSSVLSYNNEENINSKESAGQPYTMNTYNHQLVNLPKQHLYPSAESKKSATHFNQNSVIPSSVSKQTAAGHNLSLENTPTVMQFSNSTANTAQVQEQSYNKPGPEEQTVKTQQNVSEHQSQHKQTVNPQHQQQHFGRSSNKESVTNLHRPPVNWMTAPDIRSHQHHSGPSFGNSSSMNSSQGILYFPDQHSKDSDGSSSIFDQSANFHCLDISHSGQSLFKGNELHVFGNETIENFHDNSAWSPNKNGGSSILGNMIIPSTLPTLVGDLALGDNNISRSFLPSYANDPQMCPKKHVKRSIHSSRRGDKSVEETNGVPGQECAGSFLSVSQLVDSSGGSKNKNGSSTKETNLPYSGPYNDESMLCQSSKQSSSKSTPSNYSTEALLSSPNVQQMNQLSHRKRRSHGAHYSNNFVGGGICYQNTTTSFHGQGSQSQFLPELPPPRSNDYQGTFLHSDAVPTFMLGNPSRSHRNHTYSLQNVSDRPSSEETSNSQRTHHSGNATATSSGGQSARHRTGNNNPVHNVSTSVTVPSTSNIMDFGYINMPSAMLQDDMNFSNHPPPHPPPPFLPHHTYSMPAPQDTLYATPRLHPPQNSNIQSASANTLTNFHLSAIFPEINEKVIC